ncbi:uncharacterized protein At3g49055-like [Aristolochia californica]|uniref:uncharacterized protein At3g49055-like n=1 Tax=Aristolochia californica TaxID=171875 RepID=UPI0035D68819
MEDAADASVYPVNSNDLPSDDVPSDDLHASDENSRILAESKALEISYQDVESKCKAQEEALVVLQYEKDEAQKQNLHLVQALEEISNERDNLLLNLGVGKEREDELIKQKDDAINDKLHLEGELQVAKERILELNQQNIQKLGVLSLGYDSIKLVKDYLARIAEKIDEKSENFATENGADEYLSVDDEADKLLAEIRVVHELSKEAEERIYEYEEKKTKEMKQLENSIVSLTEENRDISSLLRIALVEKDKLEKHLNRLKGGGEQKRVALLQFAEKGLQKVGFGFMVGAATGDSPGISSSSAGPRSDSSECEEEVVSLASTVEKIMKNLRLEISQLKQSLEDSGSENVRLQSLTEKQAHKIAENALYIRDLEEREIQLTQNVEELMTELTEAEEDVTRWKEACELEVEAGKTAIEGREKEVAALQQELDKARSSFKSLTNKLKLKEELASAAVAAQEAAERSLRLVDSRCAGFRDRVEELTRQLEEAESKGERSGRRTVRHVCWPWRALRLSPAARRSLRATRRGPEMEALLHFNA